MIGKMFSQLRLVVLTVSMLLIQLVSFSQNLISVSFNNGAIGTKGNNVRDLSNATNFSTLQITKSYFIQNSSVSSFQVQGNAVTGTLRLVTATNAFVDVPGAMEWSDNGGVKEFVGFIPSSNLVSFNLNTYGGSNYVIDNTKNFALVYNSSSLSFTNGSSITGNSSNPLSALNAYLTSFNASRPAGPVTVTSQTTSSSNPTITGTATLGSGESLSIEFNGVVYTSGITRPTSTTWSWTVPNSVTLTAGTYNVGATITNAGGYTLSDATNSELVISNNGPIVTSVVVPADANYSAGQKLTFHIVFDAPVTVTGTPRLSIAVNQGGTVYATYTSGSGTNTLTFEYTIRAGLADPDGINLASSIDLNSGTIKNATNVNAVTQLASIPSLANVRIGGLFAYEPFTGVTNGALLTGTTGGYGLIGAWTTLPTLGTSSRLAISSKVADNSDNFQFPSNVGFTNDASNVGKVVYNTANGQWWPTSNARQLAHPVDLNSEGVLYVSFLFRDQVATLPTVDGQAMMGFATGVPSSTADAGPKAILFGYSYADKMALDVGPANQMAFTGDYTASSANTFPGNPSGKSYFMVGKITTTTSGSTSFRLKAFVPTDIVPLDESTISWDVNHTENLNGLDLTHLLVQLESMGLSELDEVRIGSNYFDVVGLTPSAPQTVQATTSSTSATVSFTPPISGTTGLTGYVAVATATDGSGIISTNGSTSPITISGLNPSKTYTYKVAAINAAGVGTYGYPAPRIISISPSSSLTAGGGTITITGENFHNPSSIVIGGVTATNVVFQSSTSLTATIPANTAGVKEVKVSGLTGVSNAVQLTYSVAVAPVITSFTPTTAGNGETVVITGTGFTGATSVKFGNVNATSFVVNSNTQITAVVGAAASGDVYVQNSTGNDIEAGFIFKVVELKFEGNTLDQTAADRDGTVVGTATYGPGASGQAICFTSNANSTSVSNYLSLPNDLIRGRGTNFTISLRFKTATFGAILGYQNRGVADPAGGTYVPILYVQENGKLSANLWQGAAGRLSVISTNRVDDNNWHKVEFSVAPGSITVYIDGVFAGSSTGTIDHLTMEFNQIGAVNTAGTWGQVPVSGWIGFTGCIDEFIIVDRSLTASQIQQVTQLPTPTITSFTPTTAKSGETVTITGTNFGSASSVKLGGVEARRFNIVSATEIRAIVPFNATVNTTVEVTTAAGTISGTTFTYDCNSNALDFDATNDHVVVGDIIENLGAFTQEAWVYWKGSSQPYSEIFSKETVSALSITNTNKLHANFGNGTSWGAGVNSTTSIPLNTWTHVAVTRSSSAAVKLYINGVLDASSATLSLSGQNTNARVIGGKLSGNNLLGSFSGSIDELKAWNTERTAQQIITGMGTELIGNESGLIAYYNFNQGTAAGTNTTITTLNNITAATNLDGTLTDMARSGTTSNFVSGVWPVIVTQPAATLALCTNATSGNVLTVSAVGQQLTYQWYSNSTNSNSGGTAISGANTASFTVPTSSNGTVYYYVVVSGCSSTPITSNVSAITVSAPAVAGTLSGSQSICVGLTTSFSSTETGGTWSSSNAAIATVNASSGLVTGVGSGTATMTYTVIGCSSVSATRTVIVTAPPAVPVLSGSQNVCINGTTQFIATGESGALTFNGTTNIVETANNISALNITGNITVETWVKVNQMPSDWVRLVGKGDGSTRTYGFWLATNGQLLWQIYGNGTDPALFSTTSLQTGTWYHIAATRVGNVHTIYINGVASGSVTASIIPFSNTLPLTLGYHGSIHTYLNGQMDEVRVWNAGRTATQINDNKDVEIAAQSGLVAYYKFNQGTAGGNNAGLTTLIDESGNGNNGTLRNFALIGNASNWSSRSGVPTTAGSWTSSNTSVATVSSTGVVTGVAAGTATITFTATGGGGCAEVTATRTVTVAPIPVILYSSSSYSVERTSAITAIQPTSTGATVASYAISPALPTGLSINTTTGIISGTPSVNSTSRTYTVTATSATGCVGTTTLTLEVFSAVAPSALSYTPASQTVRQGTAITSLTPSVSGGTVASYSISPALPSGITFNTSTGVISGTLTAQQTGTVAYTITATNSGGSTTATVTLIYNTAPTDVALSSTSVAENAASGTSVATLSATDADGGDTFTYTLVSGTGSTDNASFTISGSTLSTAAVFDFETKSSYSIRVRVTDAGGLTFEKAFTISVTNVNETPTNISASASSVAENAASGTSVATLSATDIDAGDTFTYTLVSGTGDTDNASFAITGTTLSTAAVFDFETKSSYSVRVRVTDAGGLTFEKVFTISVTDVNEAPTALALSNASVLENAASGTTVGTLAGTDADAGDTHTYSLVTGTGDTDNASFAITGTTLSTAAIFNFEAKNSYSVRVRVTDAGGLSFERAFTISVTDVNEAPTLTAITDRRVYNVSTSQVVNLAGITAGPETAQSTTTSVSTDRPATFSSISVVGTQIQFTLAAGIVTPQDVVVTVRVRDNGGVANGGVDSVVRTFRLGIDPMPVASATPTLITLGATAQLSAAGANAVNYTWVAVGGSGIVGSGATINVRPRGTTTYAVVVTNSFGYQATVPVLLTVIVDYKLVPNNLVTPNGDGVNDRWVIPNIDMYPENEVMVYDKAGRAVFAKRGYNNEWDGTVNGKLLKEDAYFYVIKFNKDGALPIRGYVSIVR